MYSTDGFNVNIVSNTYSDGKGVIRFDTTVRYVGDYAFQDCVALTSITLPGSITSIGDYAFYGCTALTSIALPNRLSVIKGSTFANCTSLASVTIPGSVEAIET